MTKTLFMTLFLALLVACGGSVSTETAGSETAGSESNSGSAGASTSGDPAGGGGGGGAGSGSGGDGGASSTCSPKPEGMGGFMQPSCEDLAVLTVSDPVVTDEDGDNLVEAGESATLKLNLNEVAGVGFNYYPGVIFETAAPGLTVSSEDWYYAIFACQTHPVTAHIELDSDIPPGTVAVITARVAMINQDCPDAYAIDIPIKVY
jgi:hypothetical protein